MAELKKFLFDNFVIGGCDTRLPEPLPDIIEESVEEIEDVDVFSTPLPPVQEEYKIQETPEIIEVPVFSQDELDQRVAIAAQDGYEKGYKSAQRDISAEANNLLNDISQKLTVLLANTSKQDKMCEQNAVKVIKQALNTLVPNLLEENAETLVNKFLQDNFNNFKYNEKLSFYINPDIISYVQDSIVKLANSNDFEGKISIHKDSSLERCACRIEWENGGVEYSPDKQLEQIGQILDKQ